MASKIFANTTAVSKSATLLNPEKLARLLDSKTGEEGLKILAELSYGDMSIENPYDFEILIENEMKKHFDFISQASPDENATDCFFCELDYHNLKCAFKVKYGKIKEYEKIVFPFASIDANQMLEYVENDEYRSFSAQMKTASEEIDSCHISGSLSPSKIDYICDRHMYSQIMENLKKVSSRTLKEYFIAKLDMTNIQTLLRSKLHEIDVFELKNMLFEGGSFEVSSMISQYDLALDAIMEGYAYTKYNEIIKTLIREITEGGAQVEFEKQRDEYLVNLFKSSKYASQDADLFYGYIVAKKFEFENIRLVMVGLNNHLDKNKIRERLKELYV